MTVKKTKKASDKNDNNKVIIFYILMIVVLASIYYITEYITANHRITSFIGKAFDVVKQGIKEVSTANTKANGWEIAKSEKTGEEYNVSYGTSKGMKINTTNNKPSIFEIPFQEKPELIIKSFKKKNESNVSMLASIQSCSGIKLYEIPNGGFESWSELDNKPSGWWVPQSDGVEPYQSSLTGIFSVLLNATTHEARLSSLPTSLRQGDYNLSFCYRSLSNDVTFKVSFKDELTNNYWNFETRSWSASSYEKSITASNNWECYSTIITINPDQNPAVSLIFDVPQTQGEILIDDVGLYKTLQPFIMNTSIGLDFQITMWQTSWNTNPPSFGFTDPNTTQALKELSPDIVRIGSAHSELIQGYSQSQGFILNFTKLDTALSWLSQNLPNTKIMLLIIPRYWWFQSGGGPLPDSLKHPTLPEGYGFVYLQDNLFHDLVYDIAEHIREKGYNIDYWGILNEAYHTIDPNNESQLQAWIANYNNGTSALFSVFPNATVTTLNLGEREYFDYFLQHAILHDNSFVSVHKGAGWEDSFQNAIEVSEFGEQEQYDPEALKDYYNQASSNSVLIMDEGSAVKNKSVVNKSYYSTIAVLIAKYAILKQFGAWMDLSFVSRNSSDNRIEQRRGALFDRDTYEKFPAFYAFKKLKTLKNTTITYSDPGFDDRVSKLAWIKQSNNNIVYGLMLANKNNHSVSFDFTTQGCVSGDLNVTIIGDSINNFLLNPEKNPVLELKAFEVAFIEEQQQYQPTTVNLQSGLNVLSAQLSLGLGTGWYFDNANNSLVLSNSSYQTPILVANFTNESQDTYPLWSELFINHKPYQNLVLNPGFEQGQTGHGVDIPNWTVHSPNGYTYEIIEENNNKYLQINVSSVTYKTVINQTIHLTQGYYVLVFKSFCDEEFVKTGKLYAQIIININNHDYYSIASARACGDNVPWHHSTINQWLSSKTFILKIPQGQEYDARLLIHIGNLIDNVKAKGIVKIDDVKLLKLDPVIRIYGLGSQTCCNIEEFTNRSNTSIIAKINNGFIAFKDDDLSYMAGPNTPSHANYNQINEFLEAPIPQGFKYGIIVFNTTTSDGSTIKIQNITITVYKGLHFLVPWNVTVTTATDLSQILYGGERTGAIITEGNDLRFNNSQQTARFWGTAYEFSKSYCWDETVMRSIARRLKTHGFNLVKLVGLTTIVVNNETWDCYDKFIKILEDEGFYIYISIIPVDIFQLVLGPYHKRHDNDENFTGLKQNITDMFGSFPEFDYFYQGSSWPYNGPVFKNVVYTNNPEIISFLQNLIRYELNHTNPYTGIKYKDDPRIAFLELSNENYLIRKWLGGNFRLNNNPMPDYYENLFDEEWHNFLRDNYNNNFNLLSQSWDDGTGIGLEDDETSFDTIKREPDFDDERSWNNPYSNKRTSDLALFYSGQQEKLFNNLSLFIKNNLKAEQLIIGTQSETPWDSRLVQYSKSLDVIDTHRYYDLASASYNGIISVITNTAPFDVDFYDVYTLFGSRLIGNVKGKPQAISEFNWPQINSYYYMLIPMFMAYSRLQGFSAPMMFSYMHCCANPSNEYPPTSDYIGEGANQFRNSPVTLLQNIIAGLAFVRGDFAMGNTVIVNLSKEFVDNNGKTLTNMFALSKLNNSFIENHYPMTHRILVDYNASTTTNQTLYEFNNAFISDTNQLVFNYSSKLFKAISDKTIAIAGKLYNDNNNNIQAGPLQLQVENPLYGSVMLTSLNNQPITKSNHLLLVTVSRARNYGMQCDASGRYYEHWGSAPLIANPVNGLISLELSNVSQVTVYALNPSGERLGIVPSQVLDNELGFNLGQSLWYEIVIKQTVNTININTSSRSLVFTDELLRTGNADNLIIDNGLLFNTTGISQWTSPILAFSQPPFFDDIKINARLMGDNPVLNPGFEEGSSQPRYWSPNNWDITAMNDWDSEGLSGRSVKINVTQQQGGFASWRLTQTQNLPPQGRYQFRVFLKGYQLSRTGAVRFIMKFYHDGSLVSEVNKYYYPYGSFDWRSYSFEFSTPNEFDNMSLWLATSKLGTIWFDNVSLIKKPEIILGFRSANTEEGINNANWRIFNYSLTPTIFNAMSQGEKYGQFYIKVLRQANDARLYIFRVEMSFNPAISFSIPWENLSGIYEYFKPDTTIKQVIIKNGSLYYNITPIQHARFWGAQGFFLNNYCNHVCGTNICCDVNMQEYVNRFSKLGFNLYKTGGGVIKYLLGSNNEQEFESKFLKTDELFKEFNSHGVYIYLQPFAYALPTIKAKWGNAFMNNYLHFNDDFPSWMLNDDWISRTYLKSVVFSLEPTIMQDYNEVLTMLLNHTNSYTGIKYKDNPGILVVELSNENYLLPFWMEYGFDPENYQEPYKSSFKNHWHEWLMEKYQNNFDLLQHAWNDGTGQGLEDDETDFGYIKLKPTVGLRSKGNTFSTNRTLDLAEFYRDSVREFYNNLTHTLTSIIGVKQLIIGGQGLSSNPSTVEQAIINIADTHKYWDNPTTPASSGLIKQVNPFNIEDIYEKLGPEFEAGLIGGLAFTKVYNNSFSVSETNWAYNNKYQYLHNPILASYGNFQDWDIIIQHAYSGTSSSYGHNRITENYLVIESNPIMLLTSLLGSLVFTKAYVRQGFNNTNLKYTNTGVWDRLRSNLNNTFYNEETAYYHLSQQGLDLVSYQLALQKPVMLVFNASTPTTHINTVDHGYCTQCQSETQELLMDYENQRFIVKNSKTEAIVGNLENCISCGEKMKIENSKLKNGLLWLLSLDNLSIHDSNDLVLLATGRAINTGTVSNINGNSIIDWGCEPVIVEPLNATLKLFLDNGYTYKVYALNPNGSRKQLIYEGTGSLEFKIGETYNTLMYEIVKTYQTEGGEGNSGGGGGSGGGMPSSSIICSSNIDCDDNNSLTIDECLNPGTTNSVCVHETTTNTCLTNNDCDDNNACTLDVCINNKCSHTKITPCCGNGVCEPGEDCDIDCKQTASKKGVNLRITTPDSIEAGTKTTINISYNLNNPNNNTILRVYSSNQIVMQKEISKTGHESLTLKSPTTGNSWVITAEILENNRVIAKRQTFIRLIPSDLVLSVNIEKGFRNNKNVTIVSVKTENRKPGRVEIEVYRSKNILYIDYYNLKANSLKKINLELTHSGDYKVIARLVSKHKLLDEDVETFKVKGPNVIPGFIVFTIGALIMLIASFFVLKNEFKKE